MPFGSIAFLLAIPLVVADFSEAPPSEYFEQRDKRGNLRIIYGLFPDFSISVQDNDAEAPSREFMDVALGDFGLSQYPELVFSSPFHVEGQSVAVRAVQYKDGIQVLGGELVFVYGPSGLLQTVAGAVYDVGSAVEIAWAHIDVAEDATMRTQRMYDPVANRFLLVGQTEEDEFHWDGQTGALVYTAPLVLNANRSAKLRRQTLTSTDVDGGNGSTLSAEHVHAFDFFTHCNYTLAYDASQHQINRIDWVPGADLEINAPCSPAPTFPGISWSDSHFRQTEAMWLLKISRAFSVVSIYPSVPAIRTSAINVRVDDTADPVLTGPCCVPGRYDPTWQTLKMSPPSSMGGSANWDPPDLIHEYGHHFHWTMGGGAYGTLCTTDAAFETPALKETVADLFAGLVLHRTVSNLAYQAEGLPTAPHTSTSKQSRPPASCPTSPHSYGSFFEQGVWESLYGDDLEHADDFSWSQSSARTLLGRALAYAAKVSPTNTNYSSFGGLMYTYLIGAAGVSDATRFRRVMNHHGTGI